MEFIDECCVIHPQARVSVGSLWAAYDYWARDEHKERWPLDRRAFTERMAKRFEKRPYGHSRDRHWIGVCLKSEALALGISLDADTRTDADGDNSFPLTTRPM